MTKDPTPCARCGGKCCKILSIKAQTLLYEKYIKKYVTAPGQCIPRIKADDGLSYDYYELNPTGRGCVALTPTGCCIPRKYRPIECIIFPLVYAKRPRSHYKITSKLCLELSEPTDDEIKEIYEMIFQDIKLTGEYNFNPVDQSVTPERIQEANPFHTMFKMP